MAQKASLIPEQVQKIVARRNVSPVPLAEALHLFWNLQKQDGSVLKSRAIEALSDLYSEHEVNLRGSPRRLAKDRYRHFMQYGYLSTENGDNTHAKLSNKAMELIKRWLPQYNFEGLEGNKKEEMLIQRRLIRKRMKTLKQRISRDLEEAGKLNEALRVLEKNLMES